MQSINSPKDILIIKPSSKPYIVFTIIWSINIILGISISIKTHNWNLELYWIGLGGWLFSCLFIMRHKIILNDKKITYNSLFKTSTIELADIKRCEIMTATKRNHPTIGLYIYDTNNSIAIIINLKLFSPKDINKLLDKLPCKI
jgi:hypothetical protein